MAIRYLYLNDNPAKLYPLVEAVTGGTDEIEIVAEQATSFDAQFQRLTDILGHVDGLILDWRLNTRSNNGQSPSFHTAALAEEMRLRAAQGKFKELPIVLWTSYSAVNGFYYTQEANHDFFDRRYDQEQVMNRSAAVRKELLSLAVGYLAHSNRSPLALGGPSSKKC